MSTVPECAFSPVHWTPLQQRQNSNELDEPTPQVGIACTQREKRPQMCRIKEVILYNGRRPSAIVSNVSDCTVLVRCIRTRSRYQRMRWARVERLENRFEFRTCGNAELLTKLASFGPSDSFAMRSSLLAGLALAAVCCIGFAASAPTPFPYSWETRWWTAQIDNLSFGSSGQTFQIKYLINEEFYKPGGPVFFYTGPRR